MKTFWFCCSSACCSHSMTIFSKALKDGGEAGRAFSKMQVLSGAAMNCCSVNKTSHCLRQFPGVTADFFKLHNKMQNYLKKKHRKAANAHI